MHQGESGLDSFYMESRCQGEKIRWREGVVYVFSIAKLYSAKRRGPFPKQVLFDLFSFRRQIYAGSIYELHLCWCENLWGPWLEMLVLSFPSLWPGMPHGQGSWTKWMEAYVGILKVTPDGLRHAQVKMYLHPHSVLPASVCLGSSCMRSTAGIELSAMRTARIAWTSVSCLSQANTASWVQHEAHQSRLCLYWTMRTLSPWPGGKNLSRTKPRVLITTFPGAWAHLHLCLYP